MPLIRFPNCKVNLGLHITGRREDGYHNLETVFYPLPLTDILEMIRWPEGPSRLDVTGETVPGPATDNICLKAWNLLKADYPQLPPVQIHLHKLLPLGAGLGGGSADGAFALQMMNELFRLELSREDLIRYALQLGSDCPFFILNQPCVAKGRGEIMTPVQLDLSAYQWVLVNPRLHSSTAEAFRGVKPAPLATPLEEIISRAPDTWKGHLRNDFEDSLFPLYPEMAAIKEALYAAGAIYASMSGSGSTIYGLFPKGAQPVLDFPAHYWIKQIP